MALRTSYFYFFDNFAKWKQFCFYAYSLVTFLLPFPLSLAGIMPFNWRHRMMSWQEDIKDSWEETSLPARFASKSKLASMLWSILTDSILWNRSIYSSSAVLAESINHGKMKKLVLVFPWRMWPWRGQKKWNKVIPSKTFFKWRHWLLHVKFLMISYYPVFGIILILLWNQKFIHKQTNPEKFWKLRSEKDYFSIWIKFAIFPK